jgi:hypothetical protein
LGEKIKQDASAPEIKKASVETDASKCVQPWWLWQGLTGRTVVGALFAAAVITTETTPSATMVTTPTATVATVETTIAVALFATLALAFGVAAELWATVFTAVVATVTAATASTAMLGTAALTAAILTTTFTGTLILALSRFGLGLLGRISTEEAFQPIEEA